MRNKATLTTSFKTVHFFFSACPSLSFPGADSGVSVRRTGNPEGSGLLLPTAQPAEKTRGSP
jgi:hypothetical protein